VCLLSIHKNRKLRNHLLSNICFYKTLVLPKIS
jgi:hypothetical protein